MHILYGQYRLGSIMTSIYVAYEKMAQVQVLQINRCVCVLHIHVDILYMYAKSRTAYWHEA